MTLQAEETSHENWRELDDLWERVKEDWRGPNASHFAREFFEHLEFSALQHLRDLAELRRELEHARERAHSE